MGEDGSSAPCRLCTLGETRVRTELQRLGYMSFPIHFSNRLGWATYYKAIGMPEDQKISTWRNCFLGYALRSIGLLGNLAASIGRCRNIRHLPMFTSFRLQAKVALHASPTTVDVIGRVASGIGLNV